MKDHLVKDRNKPLKANNRTTANIWFGAIICNEHTSVNTLDLNKLIAAEKAKL